MDFAGHRSASEDADDGTRPARPPAMGAEELSEGLILMRASAIAVVRLQLAMERRDRRTACEAVDDLVAADDRLQELIRRLPATSDVHELERDVDLRRAALAREKLTLAAGMTGPVSRPTFPHSMTEAEEHQLAEHGASDFPSAGADASLRLSTGMRAMLLVTLLLVAGAGVALGATGVEALVARMTSGFSSLGL